MPTRNFLVKTINSILQSAGFSAKNHSWYQPKQETVLMVNLQKSEYGGQYYVNLGASLRSLNPADYPLIHHCHVFRRLNTLAGSEYRIKEVLDLENADLNTTERGRLLAKAMQEVALPFLCSIDSVAKITSAITNTELQGAGIQVVVYDTCGLARPQ